jgi:muconolactone delta-isomerase
LENDENSRTEYQREELKRKWRYQKAVLTRIRSRNIGYELEIGTPYHFQGLNWMIRNMKTYDRLEIPCWDINDHNKISFPEMYTRRDFEDKLLEMGRAMFTCQYELRPLAEVNTLCQESWLKYWSKLPTLHWRTMVIDPGGATPNTSDATGITIVDSDDAGLLYVVHAQEYWFTPMKLIEFIEEMRKRYDPDDIRIEKDRFSVTIADMYQHRFPLLNISFVEHQKRQKEQRIWRLRQWFENKKIFIHESQRELIDQLLTYGGDSRSMRDDILDSLSYHLDIKRLPAHAERVILESGKEFKPNVEETFGKEMDDFINRSKAGEDVRAENDSVY